jgi:hypothetical protein
MKSRLRFLAIILTVIVTGLPSFLFAETGHVKFWVEGQPSCLKETASGATTLAIGQQCPASNPIITISNASLDTDGTSDSSQDAWRMPYTVSITANQSVSGLRLFFLREAIQQPTSTYYKAWVKGGVRNGSGTIKVTGSVKEVATGDTLTLTPVTVSGSNGSTFNSSSVKQWAPGTVTGNRELQVELEIVSLTNGAVLDLSLGGGGYIKLRAQPSADNPDDPPVGCNESGNWILTSTCITRRTLGIQTNASAGSTDSDQRTAHAYEFARYNWENLSQDMARGGGEHLASLAALLNVPIEDQPAFFELAQGAHQTSTGAETPKQIVASLLKTWNSH